MENVANWIGLGLTALGMALGGMAYVQQQLKDERNRTDAKFDKQDSKLDAVKLELETRHKADLERVESALVEERTERRRELDRMEETIKGFADVAAAVISMGKSVEHLTEKFSDHQRHTDRALDEVKHTVRSMDEKLQVASTRAARTPRPSRAKK